MKDRGPVFVTAVNPMSMVIVAVLSSFILGELMYLGRVLGAIIIVTGLYVVVWGKRKDYKSSPPEGVTTDKQTINADHKFLANLNQEVIAIDMPREGTVTGDKVPDKNIS